MELTRGAPRQAPVVNDLAAAPLATPPAIRQSFVMPTRRYAEDEAAEIFRIAAELEHTTPRALPASQGLTLAELQEIGREAGLDPALVAQAAQGSTAVAGAEVSRFFGLPIGVRRTVELDRHVSDEEWERLVADLRETFDAKGVIRYDGPFRQWSNGNLHVLIEPTATGHRIRFRTRNEAAQILIRSGLFTLGFGALVPALLMLGESPNIAAMVSSFAVIGATGLGFLGMGAMRLPRWSRTRRRQMNDLAQRLERPETE